MNETFVNTSDLFISLTVTFFYNLRTDYLLTLTQATPMNGTKPLTCIGTAKPVRVCISATINP